MFFFVFSDEGIWPLARQQVQEQAPVEQVVSMKPVIPVPEQARMEPVIPEPAKVEMNIPVELQEEQQAPASSSMVRRVRWHTVLNWVSGIFNLSSLSQVK